MVLCRHCFSCVWDDGHASPCDVEKYSKTLGDFNFKPFRWWIGEPQRVVWPQPLPRGTLFRGVLLAPVPDARQAMLDRRAYMKVRDGLLRQVADSRGSEQQRGRRPEKRQRLDRRVEAAERDRRGRQNGGGQRDDSLPRVPTYEGRMRHARARTASPPPRPSPRLTVTVYTSDEPFAHGTAEFVCAIPFDTSEAEAEVIARQAMEVRAAAEETERREQLRLKRAAEELTAAQMAAEASMARFLAQFGLTDELFLV